MSAHPPPVPAEQRSDKGAGPEDRRGDLNPSQNQKSDSRHRNLAEQGRQGAVKQNTTNKGYQQDR